MTAQSEIIPGELYHIKLVIADQGNNLYDSAVFLKGGSFNGHIDLGEDRLLATENPLCEGEILTLDAYSENVTSDQWYRNEVLISGATQPTFEVFQPGIYEVHLTFSATNCVLEGGIEIEYSTNPIINNTSLTQCETSEGETLFNLTVAQSQLVTNPQEYSFLYFLYQDDAQNNLNPIENPDSFIFSNQNQMIYARVSNAFGCFSIAEIFLFTTNNTFQNPDDLESCDPNFDGFGIFDLTQNISTIENQLPVGATYILFSSYENALLNSNPIDVQEYQNYQATNNQTIYIKITANGECFGIMWFNLVVHSFDEEDLQS